MLGPRQREFLRICGATALLGSACGEASPQGVDTDADDNGIVSISGDSTMGDAATTTMPADPTAADGDSRGDTAGESSGDEASGSGSTCPGQENACGGCDELPQTLGEACGGCDDLAWQCDGTDAVRCGGFDPDATQYFPDEDEDGHGDADHPGLLTCEDPPPGWVIFNDDCNDMDENISPSAAEVCNGVDDDCDAQIDEGPTDLCEDVCCSFETVCDGTACVPRCPMGDICGANLDECCAADETCFANECIVPGDACVFSEECPAGDQCAESIGRCVPEDAVPECTFTPPPGDFDPEIGCQSSVTGLVDANRADVVATPIVVDFDGDGNPEIAFITYDRFGDSCCNSEGTVRIVSGTCNMDGTMTNLASINESDIVGDGAGYTITNDGGLAAADLDGDNLPELVVPTKTGTGNGSSTIRGTAAFKRDPMTGTWSLLWHNTDYPNSTHTRGAPAVSIANIDNMGPPEIIVGNVVLEGRTGVLRWDGNVTAPLSMDTGGIGNNGFLGPSSVVADIDLDTELEIIAGNTVYEANGDVKWEFDYTTSNGPCAHALGCDGFPAVANFDSDDLAEVVVVRQGQVFLLDDNGDLLDFMSLPSDDCANNESGPPTVADFDGDGLPEIGTASGDFYVVVDFECVGMDNPAGSGCTSADVLWQVANQDCTSRVTASSVFDFEGDEVAEVVYADESTFRIFDGPTGEILFEDTNHDSHTRLEMPVIADVDNDGNAEIVVPENEDNTGIIVWEDAADNWVRTRRVWNQHAYHITHIQENGVVPLDPEVNWLNARFNNFRQNVQPDGLFFAPDAVLNDTLCTPVANGADWDVDLSLLVRNDGALTVPAGTPVHVDLIDGGTTYPLLDTFTTIDLAPGQWFEVISVVVAAPAGVTPPFTIRSIVDPPNMSLPAGTMNECNEDNNEGDVNCLLPQ